jgi:hypothetical protein
MNYGTRRSKHGTSDEPNLPQQIDCRKTFKVTPQLARSMSVSTGAHVAQNYGKPGWWLHGRSPRRLFRIVTQSRFPRFENGDG